MVKDRFMVASVLVAMIEQMNILSAPIPEECFAFNKHESVLEEYFAQVENRALRG